MKQKLALITLLLACLFPQQAKAYQCDLVSLCDEVACGLRCDDGVGYVLSCESALVEAHLEEADFDAHLRPPKCPEIDAGWLGRPGGAPLTGLSDPRRAEILLRRAHVPFLIKQVEAIPYTKSGKKVEIAVRDLFAGIEPKNVGALRDPSAFDEYRALAEQGLYN